VKYLYVEAELEIEYWAKFTQYRSYNPADFCSLTVAYVKAEVRPFEAYLRCVHSCTSQKKWVLEIQKT